MIRLYQYRLPFITPHRSGAGTWTHREGIILHYSDGKIETVAEAAPLPGVSVETLPEVIHSLRNHLQEIHTLFKDAGRNTGPSADTGTGKSTDTGSHSSDSSKVDIHSDADTDTGFKIGSGTGAFINAGPGPGAGTAPAGSFSTELDKLGLPASAAFAVSATGLDIISQRTLTPLNELAGTSLQPKIKVNSVLGISGEESLADGINDHYREGFRTIKLKSIGEPASLPDIIAKATGRYSDLTFRIDANRSWPATKATEFLNRFAGLPVEYCEEPCPWENPDELAQIRAGSPVPIALDETITDTPLLGKLLREETVDVLIIKPQFFGNILTLTGTILENRTPSSDMVFTSSLESGIGRTVTGWLAAMTGSVHRSHGLDTGRYFKEDIITPRPVDNTLFHTDTVNGWSIRLENCNTDSLILLTTYGS